MVLVLLARISAGETLGGGPGAALQGSVLCSAHAQCENGLCCFHTLCHLWVREECWLVSLAQVMPGAAILLLGARHAGGIAESLLVLQWPLCACFLGSCLLMTPWAAGDPP